MYHRWARCVFRARGMLYSSLFLLMIGCQPPSLRPTPPWVGGGPLPATGGEGEDLIWGHTHIYIYNVCVCIYIHTHYK